MRNQKEEQGWLEDASKLDECADAAHAGMSSDRTQAKFYYQLRYARPTGEATGQTGSVRSLPTFVEGVTTAVRQLGYNSFMEVTDGCTAKVCQPLRPKVEPVAAKPDIARQCTLLSRVQDGVIEHCKFLQEATQAWEDAYCSPVGFVLFEIDPNTGEILCRRVDPQLVYWLRGEGRNPIHLFMDEAMSRAVLLERYGDDETKREAIESAEAWEPETIAGVDPPRGASPDTIRVRRAWRREIGDEEGRYLMTVNKVDMNGDGEDGKPGQAWKYDFFPFATFRSRWDHKGFGGIPMGRYIAPHHLAVNRLARIVEDSLKGAVPIVWAHLNSGIKNIHDVPYQVKTWDGSVRPEVTPTNPVSQQALARIEWHENKCYEIAGVSRGLATGKVQPGITAAVALREVVALSDQRMSQYDAKWEEGWKQAGYIIVALANEIKRLKITSKDNKGLMEEIDLSEVHLERSDYRISYGVTSALSKTIPGLLADLDELKNLGFIDAIDMAEAIGDKVPDIAAVIDRTTAAKRLAAKQVQEAIESGTISIPPSPSQGQAGLDAILVLGQQTWCQAMLNRERYSNDNIAVLHRLMKCAQAKKGQPLPAVRPVMPAQPLSQGDIVPAGIPNQIVAAPPVAPPAGLNPTT